MKPMQADEAVLFVRWVVTGGRCAIQVNEAQDASVDHFDHNYCAPCVFVDRPNVNRRLRQASQHGGCATRAKDLHSAKSADDIRGLSAGHEQRKTDRRI
eukprot:CAMPEP_0170212546 /NCGR_PEP_ID=MMETSP0116_2-20130129/5891_1 /TAXON_ID=400756 /ORGANISM="Durinskia baltica, Strain CSIRO CS-38" /LENGTH=98 /DNA_ID=CAMNT_0010463085 /DNA_START=1055 /DNA_END=1351 /DNA_ORIENTATION=+